LQSLVVHAAAAQNSDDVKRLRLRTLADDIAHVFAHRQLSSNRDTKYLERRHSLNARQARRQIKGALAAAAERE